MAGHLYWRVRSITQQDGAGRYCTIADVVFAGAVGGPQLAVGGTPTCGSQYGDNGAARGFDGDPNTEWESGNGGPWTLAYQFPNPVDILETRITVNDYYPNERIATGVVEFSDDGQAWSFSANINPTWGQTTGQGPQTQSFKPEVTPSIAADASQIAYVALVTNPLTPARSSQLAVVLPMLDVPVKSIGAQASQFAYVIPGFFYEDKSPNHGFSSHGHWAFPLLIQGGV